MARPPVIPLPPPLQLQAKEMGKGTATDRARPTACSRRSWCVRLWPRVSGFCGAVRVPATTASVNRLPCAACFIPRAVAAVSVLGRFVLLRDPQLLTVLAALFVMFASAATEEAGERPVCGVAARAEQQRGAPAGCVPLWYLLTLLFSWAPKSVIGALRLCVVPCLPHFRVSSCCARCWDRR